MSRKFRPAKSLLLAIRFQPKGEMALPVAFRFLPKGGNAFRPFTIKLGASSNQALVRQVATYFRHHIGSSSGGDEKLQLTMWMGRVALKKQIACTTALQADTFSMCANTDFRYVLSCSLK